MSAASSRSLLAWFRRAARQLPWRGDLPRDPYRVLLSEVLAQQTQIERVVPAYTAFLARFPTVELLAAAPVDDVMQAFTGLGYYRRARSLHAAAREIVAAGRWPATFEELRRLPGVGAYTAAAVAAFSFAGTEPPVDGNVARVAARVGAIALPLGSPALARHARAFAAGLAAGRHAPLVFEALIELGATVCTPSAPRCPGCPLRHRCAAAAAANPDAYPLPKPRRPTERHRWVAVWLERANGDVLLARVADGRLLAGLWLPPFAELAGRSTPAALARSLASLAGHRGPLEPTAAVAHSVTHRRIEVMPFVGTFPPDGVREARPGWGWHDPDRLEVGTSTLLAKLRTACGPPGRPRADEGRRSA